MFVTVPFISSLLLTSALASSSRSSVDVLRSSVGVLRGRTGGVPINTPLHRSMLRAMAETPIPPPLSSSPSLSRQTKVTSSPATIAIAFPDHRQTHPRIPREPVPIGTGPFRTAILFPPHRSLGGFREWLLHSQVPEVSTSTSTSSDDDQSRKRYRDPLQAEDEEDEAFLQRFAERIDSAAVSITRLLTKPGDDMDAWWRDVSEFEEDVLGPLFSDLAMDEWTDQDPVTLVRDYLLPDADVVLRIPTLSMIGEECDDSQPQFEALSWVASIPHPTKKPIAPDQMTYPINIPSRTPSIAIFSAAGSPASPPSVSDFTKKLVADALAEERAEMRRQESGYLSDCSKDDPIDQQDSPSPNAHPMKRLFISNGRMMVDRDIPSLRLLASKTNSLRGAHICIRDICYNVPPHEGTSIADRVKKRNEEVLKSPPNCLFDMVLLENIIAHSVLFCGTDWTVLRRVCMFTKTSITASWMLSRVPEHSLRLFYHHFLAPFLPQLTLVPPLSIILNGQGCFFDLTLSERSTLVSMLGSNHFPLQMAEYLCLPRLVRGLPVPPDLLECSLLRVNFGWMSVLAMFRSLLRKFGVQRAAPVVKDVLLRDFIGRFCEPDEAQRMRLVKTPGPEAGLMEWLAFLDELRFT